MSDTGHSDASSLARTWVAVLGHLEVELPRPVFETWVRGTKLAAFDSAQGVATIQAGSSFACTNLQGTLHLVILRALQARMSGVSDVLFTERTFTADDRRRVEPPPAAATTTLGRLVGALNCGFTIDRYVSSSGNLLARSSCFSLLSTPIERISPVVVFGPPGHGKSHLIHALSNEAIRRGKSVACLTAEQFVNHYTGSIREDRVDAFHQAVRSVDLLVLDDLQYLAGKKGSANELVATIDAITTAGGSVVVASECSPLELALPDRLISRLASGLITRIEPLDREARLAFIAQSTATASVSLPGWAVERIAGINGLSVRALQGVVNNAVHLSRNGVLELGTLDTAIAQTVLTAALPAERTARDIIDEIAAHFATSFEEICGRSRQRPATNARAVIAFVLKQRGASQNAIAEMLGNRDRTTVRDMLARGEKLVAEDSTLRGKFAA